MPNMPMLCIVGTTASGKTDLAVDLALKFNGEIISSDSMQIYKGFDIGTAKVTQEEKKNIPHHMIDIVDGNASYSVADFCRDADSIAESILLKNKLPILAGGTGLYIDSFVNNVGFFDFRKDELYSQKLDDIIAESGSEKLWDMLNFSDPDLAKKIPKTNTKRLKHALEVFHATGKTYDVISAESIRPPKYDCLKIGLKYADRNLLYEKINKRVDIMIENGLENEVRTLLKTVSRTSQAMNAIGYKEMAEYIFGETELNEAIEKIKLNSRHYAKRQMTWFKRDLSVVWIDVDRCDDVFGMAEKTVSEWLGKNDGTKG